MTHAILAEILRMSLSRVNVAIVLSLVFSLTALVIISDIMSGLTNMGALYFTIKLAIELDFT